MVSGIHQNAGDAPRMPPAQEKEKEAVKEMNKAESKTFAYHWIITDLEQHIEHAEGLGGDLSDEIGEANAEKVRKEYRELLDQLKARLRKMCGNRPYVDWLVSKGLRSPGVSLADAVEKALEEDNEIEAGE